MNNEEIENGAKVLLAAALTRTEKMQLLKNADTFKWLTSSQILKLIWWEWFNVKKINAFYNALNLGKAAIFAFKDAQRFR